MKIQQRVIRIRVHVETMLLSNGDDIGGVKDEKQRPQARMQRGGLRGL